MCDLELAEWETFAAIEATQTSAGFPMSLHGDFAMVSDRPVTLRRDDNGRLHGETGPAIAWRDGWSLHFWHGTRIPAEWIEDKASLTPAIALKQSNIELRRAACEILGWANILTALEARTIDSDPDPQIGNLVAVKLPDLPREAKFLRVTCGTGREFAIGIPPHITRALDAQAWIVGLEPSEFTKPEVRA
ncbi:DUF6745 domain-containing protein [Bradyrhizobium sp. RT9a]|uniref:DUF6745 domain-containing protein n=1 Tax=Bradyrhizobium sp. RT9a TaxID=3156384 RepID=UPI00339AF9CB